MNNTIKQRNQDFTQAVNALLWETRNYDGRKLEKAIRHVAENEASRYYMNYETAYRWVCRGLKGHLHCKEGSQKHKKWAELTLRVQQKMAEHPHCSIAMALVMVLDEGKASCYFMNYETARWVYYSTMRRHRHSASRHRPVKS